MQRDEREEQEQQEAQDASGRGPIVEDATMVGGKDKTTGADVIRPKTTDGKADSVTEATDPSERPDK